jgi:glycosyltransferase involved in cell wall biosynthesis
MSTTTTQQTELLPADLAGRANVVHLVNIIHPADRQVYLRLSQRAGKLTILASSPLGLHGIERSDWNDLDARLQRTVTLRRPQQHPLRFREMIDVHIPWDTISQLKAIRPDIILSHETGFRSLLSAVYTLRNPHVPLVLWVAMTEHTEKGRGWPRHVLRRWLFRRADAVVVNGISTARYVSRFGVAANRVFSAPYVTLPESSFSGPATRVSAAAHHLLYVGQFVERKGLLPFLQVLARWASANPARNVEFSLIGSGPLEAAIREFSLPPNVALRLMGRRKPPEIAAAYGTAGIFVLPTLADEWGLVVNEAMASGLPVLGSLYGQAVEVLCENGQTGWTFRPDHAEEMERALHAALGTPPEVLDAMRAAARQRVAHLTADYVADQLVDALGHVLKERQGSHA